MKFNGKNKNQLKELGCRLWDSSGLMLIPGKYYNELEVGDELTCINGEKITVKENYRVKPWDKPGFDIDKPDDDYIDDDVRCGMLAYGVYPADKV